MAIGPAGKALAVPLLVSLLGSACGGGSSGNDGGTNGASGSGGTIISTGRQRGIEWQRGIERPERKRGQRRFGSSQCLP